MTIDETVGALTAFKADQRLAQLCDVLSSFNIFDAIGATHKELWHSDFLAFLLDPARNHGLGSEFTRRFLGSAIPELGEIEMWDHVQVRREYRYVDILVQVQDPSRKVSVIIENKIWSPEAPGQLADYWDEIRTEYPEPEWETCAIFLTPSGRRGSHPRFKAVSYRVVREVLVDILRAKHRYLRPDVRTTIRHYADMLGRSIVGNTDPGALARKLYFEHRDAVKLMDPTRWKSLVRGHLEHLVSEAQATKGLEPLKSDPEYVRFRASEWENAEGLKWGTNNTTGKPLLYFTFYNFEDRLTLYLWVNPAVLPEVRTKLLALGDEDQAKPPFSKSGKEGQYYHIYKREFLTRSDYEICTDDQLRAIIDMMWRSFTDEDLPRILTALWKLPWFRTAPTESSRP